VKLPDGMTAEIQLHPGTYRSFAEEARSAYVRSRSVMIKEGESSREQDEVRRADHAIGEKYTRAYRDWLARTQNP